MKTVDKYLAFARIACVHAATERGELYGRMLFFGVVLGVFTSLWRAVAEVGMPSGADPASMVWYLAATEWIVLSTPQIHVEIQDDVRRGDIAYHLPRPVSYVGAILAQGLGLLAVRAPVLGLTAFGCAFVFTGELPAASALLYVIPFGLWAMAILMSSYVLVGLLSFWLTDVSPLYWVWQKLLFVLGGLMLPLGLYPEWLRRVAAFTPFPSLLAGPASFLTPGSEGQLGGLGLALACWMLGFGVLLSVVFRLATRSLQLRGG